LFEWFIGLSAGDVGFLSQIKTDRSQQVQELSLIPNKKVVSAGESSILFVKMCWNSKR